MPIFARRASFVLTGLRRPRSGIHSLAGAGRAAMLSRRPFLPPLSANWGRVRPKTCRAPRPRVQISTRHEGAKKKQTGTTPPLTPRPPIDSLPQGMRGAVGGGWGRQREEGCGAQGSGVFRSALSHTSPDRRSSPGRGSCSLSGLHSVGSACCTDGGDSTRPPRCHRHFPGPLPRSD